MSLAACTAITLREYVDRKFDYASDIQVTINYLASDNLGAAGYLGRRISLSEDLPAEDFRTMVDIAERTPVTLLIRATWQIDTEFVHG